MKNIREIGYKLLGSINGGIAIITVFDRTINKYIDALGNSYNSLIDADYVVRTFDTYCSSNYATTELNLMYWISLVANHEYDIDISGSGTKNVFSSGYDITIVSIYEKQPWVDGHVNNTLRYWHTLYPNDVYDFTNVVSGQALDVLKTQTFSADGITFIFTLATTNHANAFTRIKLGNIWLNSYDTSLSWGSNSPNYDNEIMDNTYNGFTVKFNEIPVNGTQIIIEFQPLINTYKVMKTFVLPTSADSLTVDTKTNLRELSYDIETI